MEPSCLFKLLLGTNWVLFLWDIYLHYRQYNVHLVNEKQPAKVKDLMSEEEYNKARAYKLDKHRFGFVSDVFQQVFTTVVLCTGWMPWMWYICDGLPCQSAWFVALNSVVQTIIGIPFDLYDTFVIEELHGFNKQTVGFYFKDTVKKLGLSLVLMSPIVLAVEYIVENGGPYFFVYTWLFVSVVILLLMTVYPAFIAPLFDKYIPLPDGELKTAIEKLAESLKYPLTKLYVVHGSKRSSHSNAYMYGFWKNKRIVLYDTLLSGEEKEKVRKECEADMTEEEKNEARKDEEKDKERGMSNKEVVAVLGHELGHWALSHTLINLIITEVNMLLMFAVFAYFYKWNELYTAFGFRTTPTVIGLFLVFTYVTALYNQIMGVVMSMHSRRCEFDADEFAQKLGYGKELCTALTKLSKDNLSLPIDDHLYSMCNHSHPPIIERIAAIEAMAKKD